MNILRILPIIAVFIISAHSFFVYLSKGLDQYLFLCGLALGIFLMMFFDTITDL